MGSEQDSSARRVHSPIFVSMSRRTRPIPRNIHLFQPSNIQIVNEARAALHKCIDDMDDTEVLEMAKAITNDPDGGKSVAVGGR